MTDEREPRTTTATLEGGLGHNMRRYRTRVSGSPAWGPFLWQGTVLTLLTGFPTVLGSVLRGRFYRSVLGSMGQG